jgi:hypothetical protein
VSGRLSLRGSRQRHGHFRFNVSHRFFGALESFRWVAVGAVRRYDFSPDYKALRAQPGVDPAKVSEARKLHDKLKNRRIIAYLPVRVFGPSPRVGLTGSQYRLMAGLTRELTRDPAGPRSGRADSAELVTGARVPDALGGHQVLCPLLDAERAFVTFGGNGKRRGKGYRLFGARGKGWLHRCGFLVPADEAGRWRSARRFLGDLARLAESFGLVVVGVHPHQGNWRQLGDLQALTRTGGGRAWLEACHLRVYTAADYLSRWRGFFGARLGLGTIPGGEECPEQMPTPDDPAASPESMTIYLRDHGINQSQLAAELGLSPAPVSYRLSGKRPWSAKFRARLEGWLAGRAAPPPVNQLGSKPS